MSSLKEKPPKGMHPEQIKAAIRIRGANLTDLSLEWGFSDTAISKALKTPMPSVEPLISKFIGVPLCVLWPDRYDSENIRIRPVRDKNERRQKRKSSHCKK